MSNDYTLPPVPAHPDWQVDQCNWLERERDVIASYGHAVAAPLLARIAELEGYCHEWNRQVVALHEGRDRLRAEVEALRSGINRALTRARVFDDGSDGADGESARSCVEILSALIDAARKGEGVAGA